MKGSNETLLQAYKNENDGHERDRLQAMCHIQIHGFTVSQTAEIMFTSYQNVRNWRDRYEKHGLQGLKEGFRCGRPVKIPKSPLNRIKNIITAADRILTPIMLNDMIKDRCGYKYSIPHVRRIMLGWDMSPKVPQKVHVLAASKEECSVWCSNILRTSREKTGDGYAIFIQDESIFSDSALPMKKYWNGIGVRPILPWNGTRKKFIVYGFVSLDSRRSFFRSDEKFSAPTFLKYVKEIRRKFDKVVLIVDRARQHTSKAVINYLKECNGDVLIKYLPSGSPHLGMIERCWGICKKDMVHSEYYPTINNMKSSVMEYLRTKRYHLDGRSFIDRALV